MGLYREAGSPVMASICFRKRIKDHFAELKLPPATRKELDMRDIPLDDDVKIVLAWAVDEANSDGSKRIEPEHLLRGLLCFENATSEVLKSAGFDLQSIREASKKGGPVARFFRKVLWHCRLILLESIWPAFWRLTVFFLVVVTAVLLLHWLGIG